MIDLSVMFTVVHYCVKIQNLLVKDNNYHYTLQVSTFNAKVGAEMHFDDESSIKWTDTSAKPPIIVGEPVS